MALIAKNNPLMIRIPCCAVAAGMLLSLFAQAQAYPTKPILYIDIASLQIFNVAPFVKQGKLRALGVTSRVRSPALPDIATLHQQGLTDFENYNWNAVLMPAKTPAAIVSKIQGVLAAAIQENRDLFGNQGQEPGGESGEQLIAFIRAEIERYEKVARTAQIPRQ